MATTKKLMGTTAAAGGGALAIEDVFSTYLYTGNDTARSIVNGIDLSNEGGLVWIKSRSSAVTHSLFDTERGINKQLRTNGTDAEFTASDSLTSFNSDGFSLGTWVGVNSSAYQSYASWTFRKAPRFFDVVTYTGDGAATRDIAHGLDCEVGSVIIKRTDASANWFVYERTSSGNYSILLLNTTDAGFSLNAAYNPTTTTFSAVTPNGNHNVSGATYVAYLFAHDPLGPSGDGSDGLISCGSYTGNGLADGPEINLGWEPQWLLFKNASTTENWRMFDTMRGIATPYPDPYLDANLSNAETSFATTNYVNVEPTGFSVGSNPSVNGSGNTIIYIAIRRGPMRQPTSGTEVFQPYVTDLISPSGSVNNSGNNGLTYNVGFPPDFVIQRNKGQTDGWYLGARLTGYNYMKSETTAVETSSSGIWWDSNIGAWNGNASYGTYNFKRSKGFFDVVAYTGDGVAGRTVPHNLGVAPEMIITKRRDGVSVFGWIVSSKYWFASTEWDRGGFLNLTNGLGGGGQYEPASSHTATEYPVSSFSDLNASGGTYIAYLFATLPGVSKVGSYTGNGSSQTIDCGFTSGARFVLIKRADSTGDWYVWDTERGIVAANDPHLSLNTTAAEVTTDDSVDPDSSGFIVNQVAATNINVSSASYIFYAVS